MTYKEDARYEKYGNGMSPVRSKLRRCAHAIARLARASNGMSPVTSRGRLNPRPTCNGMSTLELLIAITILTLAASAAITVAFGGQSVSLDIETHNEAITKATTQLETARALSRSNFAGVVSSTVLPSGGNIYTTQLSVADLTPCLKQVTSTIMWTTEKLRPQNVALSSELADIAGVIALGGDCVTTPPIGGWTVPHTFLSRDLDYTSGDGDNRALKNHTSAGTPATDVDVLNKMIYMTVMPKSAGKYTFFVLDGTTILSHVIPPMVGGLNTGAGLHALDVARDPATGNIYAYIANSNTATPFQVINVSDPANPTLIASIALPGMTTGMGQSIFYYDKKVYIGTQYLPCVSCTPDKNNELHIFDVANPTIPVWKASIKVNRNVNAITVRNGLAYLATGPGSTSPYTPLKIFDVNPSSPTYLQQVGYANAPGSEAGTALSMLGTKVFLGLEHTPASRPDFYVLDARTPLASPLPILGKYTLGLHSNTQVTGISALGTYAFLGDNDSNNGFLVFDVSHLPTLNPVSAFNFSNDTAGLDYENGFIYTSNNQNDGLRILRPAQCADQVDNDSDGKIDSADPDCHTDLNANNSGSYNPEIDHE